MSDLTPRQAECFTAIEAHVAKTGEAPTVRELADALGLKSPNPAYQLMLALLEKEYITWTEGVARSLEILKPTPKKRSRRKAA